MRIKVCGLTTIDQIHQAGELGASFAGLIFYPKSPRFVLRHGLTGEQVKKEKFKAYKIGVFVNASYDEVMNHVENFGLDMVQLHGNETPYQCDRLASYIQVIKAFRFAEYDHVQWMIRDYYGCCDMFLFDTGIMEKQGEAVPGPLNRKFNWRRLSGLNIGKPFFLSGAIDFSDVALIRSFMQDPVAKDLFCIDINSRFETVPGIKDMDKVARFMFQLRP